MARENMSPPNTALVLVHLGYEWWMFRATHDILLRLSERHDPVRNALVESLAIHGRSLIEYFFPRTKRRDSDWNVLDLLNSTALHLPAELDDWRQDVNVRVAHLTSTRANPLTEWKVAMVRQVIQSRIDDVISRLGSEVPDDWVGYRSTSTTLLSLAAVGSATLAASSPIGATGSAGR